MLVGPAGPTMSKTTASTAQFRTCDSPPQSIIFNLNERTGDEWTAPLQRVLYLHAFLFAHLFQNDDETMTITSNLDRKQKCITWILYINIYIYIYNIWKYLYIFYIPSPTCTPTSVVSACEAYVHSGPISTPTLCSGRRVIMQTDGAELSPGNSPIHSLSFLCCESPVS